MWWDVLKVDIDFSDKPRGMGHYQRRWMDSPKKGKIEINPAKVKEYLTSKLERKPTDEELETYIKRVIMHESMHAGHDDADPEFWDRPSEQGEYIAYQGMFPENPYIAIKEYLLHPDTYDKKPKKELYPGQIDVLSLFGLNRERKDTSKKMEKLIQFVDRWAKTNSQKANLTKLELVKRKELIRGWNDMTFPNNFKELFNRYDNKHRKFLMTLEPPIPGGN
tara:strand:+ start:5733 stop:6395 length:663 start_codon:yes stop_codon:yes gene_type:complete